MTIKELATYIEKNKGGKVPYPYGDDFTITHHIRIVLHPNIHITNEHIKECCVKASTYDEFVELCLPLAIVDTQIFVRERDKPPPKGRTRRRFR